MALSSESGRQDWDAYWEGYAASAALNPAQAYRRKLVFDHLAIERDAAPRVLDLGSGTGDLAWQVAMALPRAEICGVDLSESAVKIAARKVPRARFFQQDFTRTIDPADDRLAPLRGWATHAVCSEVLEHVDDPVAVLRNVRPLLAPGCKVLVTVPGGPMSAFDRHIGHRAHFDRGRLDRTLKAAGLRVEAVRGAGFPFFNVYRMVVIARGERLVADAEGAEGDLPLLARAVMRGFSWLFSMNDDAGTLGWQLVAVASEPG
jgi:2-polyprenyl-3-methyl-5-hydroxy-6-metoxy-1,4-benzoquinol methylase